MYWPNKAIRWKGTFKEDQLSTGTSYYEDGTVEYTIANGVKKLSSAAERISKLEDQLQKNNEDNEASNKLIGEANDRARQGEINNWENSPCLVVIEEQGWRSYGFGSDRQKEYRASVSIPVFRNGNKTYRETKGIYSYTHITAGIIDSERWYWGVDEPRYELSNIRSEYDAQKAMMNQLGCKSWSNK